MMPAVAVGTLLAARRPRNPIGWLVLAIFLLAVASVGDYAIIDYRMHHGTLPLGSVAVVLSTSWPYGSCWSRSCCGCSRRTAASWPVAAGGSAPGDRWGTVGFGCDGRGRRCRRRTRRHHRRQRQPRQQDNRPDRGPPGPLGCRRPGQPAGLARRAGAQVPARILRTAPAAQMALQRAAIFVVSLFLAVLTPGNSSA